MGTALELLAPAKDRETGFAAIDCGADAVYIAGPSFGAREAAGNPMSEIRALVEHAHRFGARIYLTINTILFDDEIGAARDLALEARDIGCDALIVQDFALSPRAFPLDIPVFASTQADIRTPERARLLESLGFDRLILARELSLEEIASIRAAVSCGLEAFVHGALCVSYSGRCYLSQYLTGRSANRGRCAQPCRSRYDLVDADGRVLASDEGLLFLKDLRRDAHLGDLVDAGVTSFKIEGRLKNASYVKNVVLHYRRVLDAVMAKRGDFEAASLGRCDGGFAPDPALTFNRGFTAYGLDGCRGDWRGGGAEGSLGERVGTVAQIQRRDGRSMIVRCRLDEGTSARSRFPLANGDGLLFAQPSGATAGMRADVVRICEEEIGAVDLTLKWDPAIEIGAAVHRNHNVAFERELAVDSPARRIRASVDVTCRNGSIRVDAAAEGGARASCEVEDVFERAKDRGRMEATIRRQMGKSAEHFVFEVEGVDGDPLPFVPLSVLNGLRRDLAKKLADAIVSAHRREPGRAPPVVCAGRAAGVEIAYTANCANEAARAVYREMGVSEVAPAYELDPPAGAELMRTRLCLKRELGWCPAPRTVEGPREPLWLVNNGRRLRVSFDCEACEMIVSDAPVG